MLVEEQSTICYNMPMRFLIYVTHEYEEYIHNNKILLHGMTLQKFPKPEFYVVDSTGKMGSQLKLSDAFEGDDTFLQLNVKVISSESIVAAPNLQEYLNFIHTVDEFYHETGDLEYSLNQGLKSVSEETIVGKKIIK